MSCTQHQIFTRVFPPPTVPLDTLEDLGVDLTIGQECVHGCGNCHLGASPKPINGTCVDIQRRLWPSSLDNIKLSVRGSRAGVLGAISGAMEGAASMLRNIAEEARPRRCDKTGNPKNEVTRCKRGRPHRNHLGQPCCLFLEKNLNQRQRQEQPKMYHVK